MQLSQEAIDEFKQIWLEEFGEEISDTEAKVEGTLLINLFKIIYRDTPKNLPKE